MHFQPLFYGAAYFCLTASSSNCGACSSILEEIYEAF